MAYVNFVELQKIVKDKNAKTRTAKDSSLVLNQFLNALSNFMVKGQELNEDELAMLTISLQTWLNRKDNIDANFNFDLGDIVYTDLGINYRGELAYGHPVIIIEKVGNMVVVVPVTTGNHKIEEAYHPVDNIDGNKYYRKVNKNEDNFEDTCVIILSNVMTISAGRLLKKHDSLKESISNPDSLFVEIKNKIFEYYLPKYFIQNKKLEDDNNKLRLELTEKNATIEKVTQELLELSDERSKLSISEK